MKRVHAAANLVEAHLLVHLLADRGIRARVLNANASSVAGELPIDQAMPQVWVGRRGRRGARARPDRRIRPHACRPGEEVPRLRRGESLLLRALLVLRRRPGKLGQGGCADTADDPPMAADKDAGVCSGAVMDGS
jgi:hypothetical protein